MGLVTRQPEAMRRRGTPLAGRPALRLIVNTNASGIERRIPRDALLAALRGAGAEVELQPTATVEELAAAWADDDGRRLVLVGGDGTVHAAARLGGPRREVALIPAGRANNVARSLGIPLDWRGAAHLAATGEPHPIDLMEARTGVGSRIVIESVSVGFLAQARVRYHGRNSADLSAGLRAGAGALAGFHPFAVRVAGPSGEEILELAQLFVANLPLYEFGLHVAPAADPTDATLDVVGISGRSRRAVLEMLYDLHRGKDLRHLGVHLWRSPNVSIQTDGCSPIVADSTDLGSGPVELRTLPAALRLVRP